MRKKLISRPWGFYNVLMARPAYQVRRLVIYPGHDLDRQVHKRKNELWLVVDGRATYWTSDEGVRERGVGEIDGALAGVRHQIANRGDDGLIIIEVQWGEVVADDDVQRFSGRIGESRIEAAEMSLRATGLEPINDAEALRRLQALDCDIDNATGWGAALAEALQWRDAIAERLGLPKRRRYVFKEPEGEAMAKSGAHVGFGVMTKEGELILDTVRESMRGSMCDYLCQWCNIDFKHSDSDALVAAAFGRQSEGSGVMLVQVEVVAGPEVVMPKPVDGGVPIYE